MQGTAEGSQSIKKERPKQQALKWTGNPTIKAECLFVDFIRPSLPVTTFVF